MFDPVTYMQGLHSTLKATKDKYHFARVSGTGSMEEVLSASNRHKYYFAVDDSQDGETFRGSGAGYFERRVYTVYILGRANYGDMDKRAAILAEAQTIFRSLVSKMIADKLTISVLNMERIRFYEVPPAFANGCAGLYFNFTVENTVNLTYNAADWES